MEEKAAVGCSPGPSLLQRGQKITKSCCGAACTDVVIKMMDCCGCFKRGQKEKYFCFEKRG